MAFIDLTLSFLTENRPDAIFKTELVRHVGREINGLGWADFDILLDLSRVEISI
jgi:hypothetical protein